MSESKETEKKKVEKIYVRLGVSDYILTKDEYEGDETEDIPSDAYFIGYEDDEGNECDEEGTLLN